MQTAADLIAHLEVGGLIAKGTPERPELLRFEIYEWHGGIQKHLGAYGWGSALGTADSRLKDVLENPHLWVKINAGESRVEMEANAKVALEKTGHWDEEKSWEWVLEVTDERKPNV